MSPRTAREPLLLDEMFSPAIAEQLRRRGHDVLAVAATPELRSMSDPELYEWAGRQQRRIVTENVKDSRPLLTHSDAGGASLLFTSSRTFPRSRNSVALIVAALECWLRARGPHQTEEWLARIPDE